MDQPLHIVWWQFDLDHLREPGDGSPYIGVHSTVMYSDMFPEGPDCVYVNDFAELPEGAGAIVIVAGCFRSKSNPKACNYDYQQGMDGDGFAHGCVATLNDKISKLPWVVVASFLDENSQMPLNELNHPNMKIWVEEPKPGRNPELSPQIPMIGMRNHDNMRRLPVGYSRWIKLLPNLESVRNSEYRPLDWFFSGQNYPTHPEWMEAIRALPGRGKMFEVDRQKHTYPLTPLRYMEFLASAKVLPCRPANSMPETGRVYEALEVGTIPIVCSFPGAEGWKIRYDWRRYWEYILGEKVPFPVIDGPEQLADAVRETLRGWPENARVIRNWWQDYKQRLMQELREEVAALRGSCK